MTRLSLLFLLAVAACGSESPEAADAAVPPACDTPRTERLLPIAVGATWLYDITTADGTFSKQSTVEAFEDVGAAKAGTAAFRIRTDKVDGATVSWQEDTCSGVVRHREQSLALSGAIESDEIYQPSKLRVDESAAHLAAGASWTDTYSEITVAGTHAKTETWTVVAVDEAVTTEAGTFACIHLSRVGADSTASAKDYWFAPGVGKVREEGDQLEELIAYELP